MALTTSLSKRDYIYDAVMEEAPLLASPELALLLDFASIAKLPDLTSAKLSSPEAALVGTAFDYLQRRVVTGEWRREPRWQAKHLNRFKLLPDMYLWATEQASFEVAALTMAFLDQMKRVGVTRVVKSPAHRSVFQAVSLESYEARLPESLVLTLQELQILNAPIMDEYASRAVRVGGPHIFGSHLAHGADPDAIYGRSLVELKTHRSITKSTLTAGLTQALSYALLDSLDEYRLDHVELWHGKQGHVLRVPLETLVPDMGESRRRLGLKLRWALHARDQDHAKDLIQRGTGRAEQIAQGLLESELETSST